MINISNGASSDLAEVVHQFLCYLETLVRQVKMRAVLADESNPAPNRLSHGIAMHYNEALPLPQTNTALSTSALGV
jgi:hypothetical protein